MVLGLREIGRASPGRRSIGPRNELVPGRMLRGDLFTGDRLIVPGEVKELEARDARAAAVLPGQLLKVFEDSLTLEWFVFMDPSFGVR